MPTPEEINGCSNWLPTERQVELTSYSHHLLALAPGQYGGLEYQMFDAIQFRPAGHLDAVVRLNPMELGNTPHGDPPAFVIRYKESLPLGFCFQLAVPVDVSFVLLYERPDFSYRIVHPRRYDQYSSFTPVIGGEEYESTYLYYGQLDTGETAGEPSWFQC